jgi:two-component sensor histidine kinase
MLKPQRTLLLIDDNPADRHIIKRYLHHDTEHHYLFVEAETGDQGLQWCSTTFPDCILIDYNLPDMNGLELLAELVSRNGPHFCPIVMMTGEGDEKVAVQAIQGGAQDYLVKGSLTRETLLIAVENAIEKVEMRRNLAEQQQHLERQNAELQQKQNQIRALNVRLQRAMAESHHRIKNNLQTLAAVVDMAIMDSPQTVPLSVLNRLVRHIQTLASLHDLLTIEAKNEAEMDVTNVKIALERLSPMIQATSGGRQIDITAEEVCLPLKQSSAFLLLANELISNALKHGKGDVRLALSLEGTWARLEVMDEGEGFPAGFDPQVAANTGMELVESISRHDLRGSISYENRTEGGGRVVVLFPTQPH